MSMSMICAIMLHVTITITITMLNRSTCIMYNVQYVILTNTVIYRHFVQCNTSSSNSAWLAITTCYNNGW